MSFLIQKTYKSIRRNGIGRTLKIIVSQFRDIAFDLRYGTETVRWQPLHSLDVKGPNKNHGNIYQTTTAKALKKIFADIRPRLPEKAGILDVGSGKGKVLLMAEKFDFDPIRGIEFSTKLCNIARKNAQKFFRNRSSEPRLNIIETDAADYRIQPDEHLFFFFNPFDACIFRLVMKKIKESLREYPRPAFLIYNNPEHRSVIEENTTFQVFHEYVIEGNEILVYQHTEHSGDCGVIDQ